GRVTHSAYLGDHIEYEIETEHGKLFIVDPAVEVALSPQTDVSIEFKTRGLAIINQ
ncbi:MAG TPA: ABC transporter ATP-binding protein, partial [Ochrobactrum sp.]|nr:ABC transporter ATP-binding protein [Ochrobactrum sp.]